MEKIRNHVVEDSFLFSLKPTHNVLTSKYSRPPSKLENLSTPEGSFFRTPITSNLSIYTSKNSPWSAILTEVRLEESWKCCLSLAHRQRCKNFQLRHFQIHWLLKIYNQAPIPAPSYQINFSICTCLFIKLSKQLFVEILHLAPNDSDQTEIVLWSPLMRLELVTFTFFIRKYTHVHIYIQINILRWTTSCDWFRKTPAKFST